MSRGAPSSCWSTARTSSRVRTMGRRCGRFAHTTPSSQGRSEEHTSELQSQSNLVCRLLLEKKKTLARAMLAVTVALAAAGLAVILTPSPASRLRSDFPIHYSAGVLVRHSHLAAPYHQGMLG